MRRRKQAIGILMALALVMFMVQSCATTNHNQIVSGGYKTLATAATTYETAFQALADFYKQGLLSDDAKGKAVKYGNDFWTAYHAAVDLLASYAKTASAEDEAKLNVAVVEVTKLLGAFLEYAGPYLTKK